MEIQYWYPQTLLIFTISGNKLNNKYLIFSTIPKSLKQRQQTLDYTGHHYSQTNTNNANKTCALLQTTGGKVIVYIRKS